MEAHAACLDAASSHPPVWYTVPADDEAAYPGITAPRRQEEGSIHGQL